MPDVMTTFEDWSEKLEMVRELGGLIAHIDDSWGNCEGETLKHVGYFISETMVEFRKAMYKADEDVDAAPDREEAAENG